MAKLILMVNGVGGQHFELDKPSMQIGRAAGNNIHIDDLAVSSEHAVIIRDEDEHFPGHACYTIRDLGSTNATFVNEEKIVARQLHNNDVVRVGWNTFKFVDDNNNPSMETTAYILPD